MRGVVGLSVVVAGLVWAAPAAQANAVPLGITVSKDRNCQPSAASVVGNPGDRFMIVVGLECSAVIDTTTGGALSPSGVISMGPTSTRTFTLGALGSHSFVLETSGRGRTWRTTVSVTVTSGPVQRPALTGHDYLQQVGVPASGDCADVPIETGHWFDFPIGGWTKSWAWWINNGTGGPVCTRELVQTPSGEIAFVG